jgi:anti-sigma factor RsiW
MNCGDVKVLLYDYLRHELSAGESNAVKSHLKDCALCAEELGKLTRLSRLFKASLREPSPAILANIRKHMPSGRWSIFPVVLKPAFAMAAAIMLLAGVFLYPSLDRNSKISNTLADDYNITDTADYDVTADAGEVSFIYGNDYDNEIF